MFIPDAIATHIIYCIITIHHYKYMGLSNKKSPSSNICLKDKNDNMTFDSFATSEIFQSFYSTLASNLVKNLPTPPKRFDLKSVEYYITTHL